MRMQTHLTVQEYFNNENVTIEDAELGQSVLIDSCTASVVHVKGKVTTVAMSNPIIAFE